LAADSDGDGMKDGDEKRAGTDMLNASSYLVVGDVNVVGKDVVVTWDSVPGVKYEVEYSDDLTGGEPSFNCVSAVITAYGTTTQTTIPNGATNSGVRQFRVILAEGR
ncbi:MAG TPA: thrombospondin type 3 repeat-containing protein, partial [Kiritimatiellia bacterium]